MSDRGTTFSRNRVQIPNRIKHIDHSQYGTEVTCPVTAQLITLLQVAADSSSAEFSPSGSCLGLCGASKGTPMMQFANPRRATLVSLTVAILLVLALATACGGGALGGNNGNG